MDTESGRTYTAFFDQRMLVSGPLKEMLRATKAHLDAEGEPVLIFDDETGRQVDFDFRGTPDDVLARVTPTKKKAGPGRPRLGVVAREVTLLPRHWSWLEQQRGGISAALRRLVDEARKREPARERARRARDAAATFTWAMAGDLPRFEEASRALFADDPALLEALTTDWPPDIRAHVLHLTQRASQLAKN